MAYQIIHRHSPEEEWNLENPILADGEIGYVKGSSKYKIGDGVTPWKNLEFFGFNGNVSGLGESPDPEHEVVDKKSLINKFTEVDNNIKGLQETTTKQESSLTEVIETIGSASGDNKTGLVGDIDNINNILNDDRTGITALNTKTDKLDKEVFGSEAGPEGSPEKYTGLKERVEVLEKIHKSVTQAQYDNLAKLGQLSEGTFYYIYEEAKQ